MQTKFTKKTRMKGHCHHRSIKKENGIQNQFDTQK